MDDLNDTVVLVREVGSILDTIGLLGVLAFLGILFVNGKIHSSKSVEKTEQIYKDTILLIIEPYKKRVESFDNGFNDRLLSIEESTRKTEEHTAKMATQLERQFDSQMESRERMANAVTKLSTILDGLQISQAVKTGKRR